MVSVNAVKYCVELLFFLLPRYDWVFCYFVLMSADLKVWYSEVMQAERDFNNLARSSTTSDYSDSTLSVRDARNRFEQLSASTVTTPSRTGQRRSESSETPPARPPPPRPPLKKRVTDPEICTLSTNPKGQSASNLGTKDVNSKLDSKAKKSLKKAHSVRPTDLVSTEASSPASSNSKKSIGSKKLFKRMSVEKAKVDSNSESATNGSANSKSSTKKGEASQNSSNSPHKKTSPLASMKKKLSTDTKSNSSQPSSQSSSPVDKPGKKSFQKSFSDKVLATCDERSVQASLGDEDRGKVVGGSRPATPRVIEDGELKLNLTEGTSMSS